MTVCQENVEGREQGMPAFYTLHINFHFIPLSWEINPRYFHFLQDATSAII